MRFISIDIVLNKLSKYIYFSLVKILLHTLFASFKIVKNRQCIIKYITCVFEFLRLKVCTSYNFLLFVKIAESLCVYLSWLLSRKILKACNFFKKETLILVFSCEFCKVFKNPFFKDTLKTSDNFKTSNKSVWSNVFWYVFNTPYIEIKHKS